MIARAAPIAHYYWITSRAGEHASDAFRAIEAVDDNGKIHGMVGFDNWTENSVVVNIALENPASLRTLIRPVFEYAFNQARLGVMLCMVRDANHRSKALVKRIGFREVYRIKDGIKVGEDMILFEMRKEECRWIEQRKAEAA